MRFSDQKVRVTSVFGGVFVYPTLAQIIVDPQVIIDCPELRCIVGKIYTFLYLLPCRLEALNYSTWINDQLLWRLCRLNENLR